MSTTNPYQSPQSPCNPHPSPTDRSRVWATVFAIFVGNVALNAYTTVRNWPELTPIHHLIGVTLWLALPLFAMFLLWRGRPFGRWILVGLFVIRAIGEVLWLAFIARYPSMLLSGPGLIDALRALFYISATVWLAFSPSIGGLCKAFRPEPTS
jgi:hypothetical protein